MPEDISLAFVGGAATYFAQIGVAYGLARILSRLIPSARVRMWLWSGFLLGAWLGWLAFLVVPFRVFPGPARGLHWSYRLEAIPSDLRLWETWGLRFYLSVVVISLLLWAYRRFRLRTLVGLGQAPSPDVCLLFGRLAKRMKVKSCQIVLVPELRSPSMVGWLRPYVLVPVDLLPQLERTELIDVLLHELIHVRRRDYVWDQLAAFACRIVFFHPAAWLAHRHLRRERELACDQAMGGQLATRRLRYAECLMRLAKWWFLADRYSVQGIGVSSTASFLATRVRMLLEEPRHRSKLQLFLRAGVVAMTAMGGAYGLLSSSLSFYHVDGLELQARSLARSVSRGRHARSLKTPARLSVRASQAGELERNDSELVTQSELEKYPTGTQDRRAEVPRLTPAPELDGSEESWSSDPEPGFRGESKPVWNQGSIERSPLEPPRATSAAAVAARVALGVALAIGDDDFVGRR